MSTNGKHDTNNQRAKSTTTDTVTLTLPGVFIELCHGHQVQPGTVLQGFIADLCGLNEPEAGSSGQGEQAGDPGDPLYYAQVGYAWLATLTTSRSRQQSMNK
ncbi:MAG: hypothetical protein HEQ39_05520 [Rhizobacter sp.]